MLRLDREPIAATASNNHCQVRSISNAATAAESRMPDKDRHGHGGKGCSVDKIPHKLALLTTVTEIL